MAKPMKKRILAELEKAIDCFESQREFCERLGIKSPSLSEWKREAKVPPERAAEIERMTNGIAARRVLCPSFPWD